MQRAWCLTVLLVVACATNDDDAGGGPADARRSDAGGGGDANRTDGPAGPDGQRIDAAPLPDAAPSCVAAASYPDITFGASDQVGGVDTDPGGFRYWYWMGSMGAGAEQVLLQIQLYPGYGAFAADTAPRTGTFPITGDETSYLTCGVCVILFGDLTIDATGAVTDAAEDYLADGGTLTIDRVDTVTPAGPDAGPPGAPDAARPDLRITGSFAGLTFNEIDVVTAEPLIGGCRTAAPHGVFDAALDPPP